MLKVFCTLLLIVNFSHSSEKEEGAGAPQKSLVLFNQNPTKKEAMKFICDIEVIKKEHLPLLLTLSEHWGNVKTLDNTAINQLLKDLNNVSESQTVETIINEHMKGYKPKKIDSNNILGRILSAASDFINTHPFS